MTPSSLSRKPYVSVIIPTYNRMHSLLCTLDSLSQQSYPTDRFEVIVVDDGGNDDTPSISNLTFPFKLLLCRQKNQGSAAARNHGAGKSDADILVFVDDDISLDPEFLLAIADETMPGILTMGEWLPYMPPEATVFARTVARRTARNAISTNKSVSFTDCTSNNLVIYRTDFLRVGMWRDVLGDGPTLWGDVVFGYTASKAGLSVRRIASARLTHRDVHISSLSTAANRAYHVARISHLLFQQYPEIKDYLSMFRNKIPVNWCHDTPRLILRKLLCQFGWSAPVMRLMESSVPLLERYAPEWRILESLYGWIISGYINRGYRDGLREVGRGYGK
jgi:glycosyltransferase involved in cell wall biosynthesis